jgi:hypothetical protein
VISIVDLDDAGEDISTFSFAYHQHLCTPFISSSSLTAGSFISHMPWSYTLEEELTAEKDESIHVFSVWEKIYGVGAIFLFFPSCLSACEGLFS